MKTNALVGITALCSCPFQVPNAISSFSSEQLGCICIGNVQTIYSLWFAFEFSICFCQEMCIWAWVNFPSPAAGMKSFLWVGFLRLVWEKGDCFPLPSLPQNSVYRLNQSWDTALGRQLFWYYMTFHKILFLFPLLQLPFPKSRVSNSLHLACMAVFLTSLNIGMASEDPICTVYNILCMQLGEWELCKCRPSLSDRIY